MVYEQFNLEKKNFILKRFKIKVFKTLENQSWIEVPKNWQLLLSNGFNIVFCYTMFAEIFLRARRVVACIPV